MKWEKKADNYNIWWKWELKENGNSILREKIAWNKHASIGVENEHFINLQANIWTICVRTKFPKYIYTEIFWPITRQISLLLSLIYKHKFFFRHKYQIETSAYQRTNSRMCKMMAVDICKSMAISRILFKIYHDRRRKRECDSM